MKKNRLFAMFLALALCIGMLAGCGSSTGTTATSTASEAEEATSAAESTAEEEEAAPAEESEAEEAEASEEEEIDDSWVYTPISYPLVEEEVVFDYWIIWELSNDTMYSDINEHIVISELAAATGITLNIKAQSQSAGQTNTDLMIASGDYPDLIGNLDYSTGMDAAIEDEVVVNIKDMIAEYAPDYYKYLIEDDYALWKAVQTDSGYIGAFVTVGTVSEVSDGLMTFQFMLDELGYTAEDLSTIDALEEYLVAAKEAYGMSSPLYLPGDFMLDEDTLCNAYGVALKIDSISGDLPWVVIDGEVKFGYLEEGFTEYVTLMNKWYEMGLIDSDTASHSTDYKNEDQIGLIAGKEIAVYHRGNGLIDLFATLSGETVVALYSPTVEEGETLHIGGAADSVSGESGLVITTGCSDVELAMNFINYLYTDEYYYDANYGIEGETYYFNDDGEPEFYEWVYSTENRTFSSVMMDYQLFTQVDANVETPGQSEAALSCTESWNSNLDNASDFPEAAAMNLEESDAYNQRAGDIVTLCQQYTAKFITGELDLSEIATFQELLFTSGSQDCIDA